MNFTVVYKSQTKPVNVIRLYFATIAPGTFCKVEKKFIISNSEFIYVCFNYSFKHNKQFLRLHIGTGVPGDRCPRDSSPP